MMSDELVICANEQGFFEEIEALLDIADKSKLFADIYAARASALTNFLMLDFLHILDDELEKERRK